MNDPLATSRDSWGCQEGLNRLTSPVPFHGPAKADHLLYRGSRRAAPHGSISGTPFPPASARVASAGQPASPARDRPARPGCAGTPALRDDRARRRHAKRGVLATISHRAHSHRLMAQPVSRNMLLQPPQQASAPLLGSQPALPQLGPTVPAPRRSTESDPHRAPWCLGWRSGHSALD